MTTQPSIAVPARARLWLALGIPSAVLATAYGPFLLLRSQLPDPLASHFDFSGRADRAVSIDEFLLVTGVMIAVGLALCLGLALYRRPLPQGVGVTAGFLGGFIAALAAGILASTFIAQRNIDVWTDAPNVGWYMLAVVLVALAIGAAGAQCAAQLPAAQGRGAGGSAPVMTLADGEQAVWSSSLRSAPLFALGVVALVAGLVLAAAVAPLAGAIAIVISVAVLALATLRVSVDRTGLRVKYGGLPWPSTRIALDRIKRASVIDVRPMHWGGWGYRGSLTLMRQAAVVHRAGPGIRVDLHDGKVFVVTVDDPETGVALLNAEIQRRGGGMGADAWGRSKVPE